MELFDQDQVRQALDTLFVAGDLYEVRVIKGSYRRDGQEATYAGFFTNPDDVLRELARFVAWFGCYVVINPISDRIWDGRTLEPRVPNVMARLLTGAGAGNAHIDRRRWLYIDLDPLSIENGSYNPDLSRTDAEKAAALALAGVVRDDLSAHGWPEPILADSGNGYHLVYRVDLPADTPIVARLLQAAGNAHDTESVKVDRSVFNAARLVKLYGTLACKGNNRPDRPWRSSAILEEPRAPEVVTEAQIAAYANAVLPPEPAPAPPREGIRAGDGFDPVALLVERSGCELGAPKVRADGSTVYELKECLCERSTKRKMVLTVSETGAPGLSCRHDTCKFNSHGKPGDHWKMWRSENDPSYTTELRHVPTTVENIAAAANFAASHANDRVDVSAVFGGFAPESDGPAPAARPARKPDGRVRIATNLDMHEICESTIRALAASPNFYFGEFQPVRVSGGMLSPLSGGALDYVIVKTCAVVRPYRDKETGLPVDNPDVFPIRVRGMIEAMDSDTADAYGVKQIRQVKSVPFFMQSGDLATEPGYHAEARTYLTKESPRLQLDPEPDPAACMAWFRQLFRDFPFKSESDFVNYIGAMLAPMVRQMIRGPYPLVMVSGNAPGVGKSKLSNAIRIVYGLGSHGGALPTDEEALSKMMAGILIKKVDVWVFDDVMHTIQSETLNKIATSEKYSVRLLSTHNVPDIDIDTMFVVSGNDVILDKNAVRRFLTVRLHWDRQDKPQDRTDHADKDIMGTIKRLQPEILSRLAQMVSSWVRAGKPQPEALPVMGSFERFCAVIGAIMAFAGETQWLANMREAREAAADNQDWAEFLAAWSADQQLGMFTSGKCRPVELWDFAKKNGLLGSILSFGNESSQQTRLGRELARVAESGQELYGYRIERERKNGVSVYSAHKEHQPIDWMN